MHVILGMTKNIYDWLLIFFGRLEKLEEEKTRVRVTCQFREGILEAKENAKKHINHLKSDFKDEIETVEK